MDSVRTTVLAKSFSFRNPVEFNKQRNDSLELFCNPDGSPIGPGSVLDPTETPFSGGNTTDGENILVMGAAGTVIHQDLVPALAYGVYLLTFDVGNRLDRALPPISLSLLANGSILNDEFKIIPTRGEGLFQS